MTELWICSYVDKCVAERGRVWGAKDSDCRHRTPHKKSDNCDLHCKIGDAGFPLGEKHRCIPIFDDFLSKDEFKI